MAKGLTTKQHDILTYVLGYVDENGYPPSIREIGKVFDIGSLRGVTVHLDALEKKGYIKRSNLPRSIQVVHPEFSQAGKVAMVPVYGNIAAGDVSTTIADNHPEDTIALPLHMVHNANDAFIIRVKGESMCEEGIIDQDLVVVKPGKEARQNDLVAVAVGDYATIKRINYTKDGIWLMPSNPSYAPIELNQENTHLIGKVIGLIRDYPR